MLGRGPLPLTGSARKGGCMGTFSNVKRWLRGFISWISEPTNKLVKDWAGDTLSLHTDFPLTPDLQTVPMKIELIGISADWSSPRLDSSGEMLVRALARDRRQLGLMPTIFITEFCLKLTKGKAFSRYSIESKLRKLLREAYNLPFVPDIYAASDFD